MSETKMELWQRKLRNGQRRGLVKEQERMWEKLTSEHETKHGNIRMSPGVTVNTVDHSYVIKPDGAVLNNE